VTTFSSGKHASLSWTLTEMQGDNFNFPIKVGTGT
jgi:hypothetical protein